MIRRGVGKSFSGTKNSGYFVTLYRKKFVTPVITGTVFVFGQVHRSKIIEGYVLTGVVRRGWTGAGEVNGWGSLRSVLGTQDSLGKVLIRPLMAGSPRSWPTPVPIPSSPVPGSPRGPPTSPWVGPTPRGCEVSDRTGPVRAGPGRGTGQRRDGPGWGSGSPTGQARTRRSPAPGPPAPPPAPAPRPLEITRVFRSKRPVTAPCERRGERAAGNRPARARSAVYRRLYD